MQLQHSVQWWSRKSNTGSKGRIAIVDEIHWSSSSSIFILHISRSALRTTTDGSRTGGACNSQSSSNIVLALTMVNEDMLVTIKEEKNMEEGNSNALRALLSSGCFASCLERCHALVRTIQMQSKLEELSFYLLDFRNSKTQ